MITKKRILIGLALIESCFIAIDLYLVVTDRNPIS